MTSRLDRRTAVAAGLLLAFAILTVLPWRNHDAFKPSFDPTSSAVLHHHTSAWAGSFWWVTCAVSGLVAGVCAVIGRRRVAPVGAVTAGLALIGWAGGAWRVHHARYIARPTTIAIANFTAGPHIGPLAESQLVSSYLAGLVLAALLVLLLLGAGNVDYRELLSRSRIRLSLGGTLLVVIAALSLLPWYTYDAFSLETTDDYIAKKNAWTTFNTGDYWRAAIVLGVIGAVTLLLRSRLARWIGAGATVLALGAWIAGTWRLHQPIPVSSTNASTYAINSGHVTSSGTTSTIAVNHFVGPPPTAVGQTLVSYAALAVLIALLLVLAVGLAHRERATRPAA